jgi:hypothetical protein
MILVVLFLLFLRHARVRGDIDQIRFGLSEVYSCGASAVYSDFFRISVAPVWDLNQDGIVDMRDLSIVARAFYGVLGSPNWNPSADFDTDGAVNFKDLASVARHLFEQYA